MEELPAEIVYAGYLTPLHEPAATVMHPCIAARGIFCSLYSDRASHFFFTPKAGGKVLEGHLTQIGRALRDLGVKMIPSYSPQARGRSERMNKTLQGRIPNELHLHGIKTKDEANRFLKEVFVKKFNQRFKVKPEQPGSAFVPLPTHFDLNRMFSIQAERTVGHDNTVSFQRLTLQIEPSELRVSFAKCRVTVHQHLDQTLSITYGPHLLGRYDSKGHLLKNSKSSLGQRAA